ncbi:hypothetical protein WJ0W_004695 [Paenibacillus melissococcoides]|uniref:Uncharacterized protein n=1 Tax=Paenibacillus melissococcoides TaxID=2912268 RepID=A0ABN8U8K0_9BACL|nr:MULTISPECIES: hypothetical protein [Paenibacillus]MEB9897686.1 hypothetical protein [Bacillus cereus]CAH8247461.1 hypothetical protein WJ0W_004695 [Paenibacillus melissococcoides]CAH8705075.1 hypothetical protein WDD9_000854 [Paenibacillus melissococcoides]CAH8708300.1 hypothetical protein HTL2_001940 [Paenibacillus melissococcoides]GIO82971.1 hypothetical protein J6TS7_65810 [Paenibacillus dendritiformis]
MTVSLLVRNLSDYLRDVLATYHTAQGAQAGQLDGMYKQVNVFEWYVPLPDQKRRESDYPFVEVRPYQGKRTGIERHTLVELTFGVFGRAEEEPDGTKNMSPGAYALMNLMEYVEIELFRQPVIGGRFRIRPDYEWTIPEEQPYPYYLGTAVTAWDLPNIINEKGAIQAYG